MTVSIGDRVTIDEVAFGSHDVIGMTGNVTAVTDSHFVVKVAFTAVDIVDIAASKVSPA